MKATSIVVVGAGVIGASAAYHLALRGRDVLVIDRGPGPATGSTGRATGGFRAQFESAVNVRLSLLAREKLLRFRDETGVDPGYVQAGYLWLADAEPELDALRAALRVQHAEGLDEAREVDLDEIARINPAVRLEGIAGGAFCPTDGFIRPVSLQEGYLAGARRLGAKVEWGVALAGFRRGAGGRIEAVQTSSATVYAGTVVNAAGAWSAAVSALAGVELPVLPLRRQVAVTELCDRLPEDMPMTIWVGDGFHLRVREGRVLLLLPTPGAPGDPFDTRVDSKWVEAVAALARQRVPVLSTVGIDRAACWAGLYEMSPDRHAILGAATGCPNLFLVNGSSGHGVMHAPALGQLLAEIVCDGAASTLDVGPLRPSRFTEGSPNAASALL